MPPQGARRQIGWVFPIPIVKTADGGFVPTQGKVADRVIGYNELSAITPCKAYVKAQGQIFPDRCATATICGNMRNKRIV